MRAGLVLTSTALLHGARCGSCRAQRKRPKGRRSSRVAGETKAGAAGQSASKAAYLQRSTGQLHRILYQLDRALLQLLHELLALRTRRFQSPSAQQGSQTLLRVPHETRLKMAQTVRQSRTLTNVTKIQRNSTVTHSSSHSRRMVGIKASLCWRHTGGKGQLEDSEISVRAACSSKSIAALRKASALCPTSSAHEADWSRARSMRVTKGNGCSSRIIIVTDGCCGCDFAHSIKGEVGESSGTASSASVRFLRDVRNADFHENRR